MTGERSGDQMEVLSVTGDPAVAEVAVARFRGSDRHVVETVDGLAPPLPREEKWIINLSTQFGCPVGCPFCDAASEYAGNPTAGELLAQVRWALARHPGVAAICRKLKIHFARMGEPSLNDAVLDAMAALPALTQAQGLWCCVATVAPARRHGWFRRLLELKEQHFRGRFQLQFSVQSTSPADRQRLIPIPHWDLGELADFGGTFYRAGDRKVVLNFALGVGIEFDPAVIAARFDPAVFALKITPINPTARGQREGFQTVLRSRQMRRVDDAVARLGQSGFDVVLSVGDGREDQVGSNCGQAVRVLRATTG